MRWVCLLLAFASLTALASGCTSGPKLVLAKGQVTYKGKPLKVDPKGSVVVVFIPEVEEGTAFSTYPARFNRDDSTFVAAGNGIPEGKYRISINQMVFPTPADVTQMNDQFSAKKTRIVRDVKSPDEAIVVDLSKPTG